MTYGFSEYAFLRKSFSRSSLAKKSAIHPAPESTIRYDK